MFIKLNTQISAVYSVCCRVLWYHWVSVSSMASHQAVLMLLCSASYCWSSSSPTEQGECDTLCWIWMFYKVTKMIQQICKVNKIYIIVIMIFFINSQLHNINLFPEPNPVASREKGACPMASAPRTWRREQGDQHSGGSPGRKSKVLPSSCSNRCLDRGTTVWVPLGIAELRQWLLQGSVSNVGQWLT